VWKRHVFFRLDAQNKAPVIAGWQEGVHMRPSDPVFIECAKRAPQEAQKTLDNIYTTGQACLGWTAGLNHKRTVPRRALVRRLVSLNKRHAYRRFLLMALVKFLWSPSRPLVLIQRGETMVLPKRTAFDQRYKNKETNNKRRSAQPPLRGNGVLRFV
jgi:hypothetical protein